MRIRKTFSLTLNILVLSFLAAAPAFPRDIVLYNFEKDPQGWEIPDWALVKKEYVARQIGVSEFNASDGKYALEIETDFAGSLGWEGAYVERMVSVTDWSPFNYLSADLFIPKDAPRGLRARFILSVGQDWKWTEMNKSVPLTPGEWVEVKVDITANSMGWRRFITDSFRSDIRKAGIRVESNGKIVYKGPVYIDNVKLSE